MPEQVKKVSKHRQAAVAGSPGARGAARRSRLAPAPGSEGTDRDGSLPMLRNSERSAFKRCRFAWDISYNQRLRPAVDRPALRFGTLVHKALADYYIKGRKRGPHPAISFEKHYEDDLKTAASMGWRDAEGDWQDAGELGVAMMNHYVEVYGADDEWEVLVTEHPFNYATEAGFRYAGVIDLVMLHLHKKRQWVWDHKTTAGIGPSTGSHLVLDDQAGGYWSFGVRALKAQRLLRPHEKLAGMMYNYLRKSKKDERPVNDQGQYLNKDGSVSKVQPSPYFLRTPVWRDEIDRLACEARAMDDWREIKMAREGELKIIKNPGQFTCPGCSIIDLCELHEVGADWQSFRDGTMIAWDPYAEHEIYIAETK